MINLVPAQAEESLKRLYVVCTLSFQGACASFWLIWWLRRLRRAWRGSTEQSTAVSRRPSSSGRNNTEKEKNLSFLFYRSVFFTSLRGTTTAPTPFYKRLYSDLIYKVEQAAAYHRLGWLCSFNIIHKNKMKLRAPFSAFSKIIFIKVRLGTGIFELSSPVWLIISLLREQDFPDPVEGFYCKRPIQCLASSEILTPHPLTARPVCTP